MGAWLGAEGGHCGLNRQEKQGRPLQTAQFHLVHVPQGSNMPGTRAYAGILAATAHGEGSEGVILVIFGSTSGAISDRVGWCWRNERCPMANNTWNGPPAGD